MPYLPDETIARVFELRRDGLELDDAVERAVMQSPAGDVFEPQHFGGDWIAAVNYLTRTKTGELRGFLDHPATGPIDVVWGHYDASSGKGAGLAKIVARHPEVVDDLPEIIGSLQVETKSGNRVRLSSDTHFAAVRLDYDGRAKTWLLTAFEKGRRDAKTTDRRIGRQADGQGSSASPAGGNISEKTQAINEQEADGLAAEVFAKRRRASAEHDPLPGWSEAELLAALIFPAFSRCSG
ncbi:MAG: hypothetical protein KDJ80_13675 [Nitratireductor sp.]|nr:hypothetical protein [Nitratireductor sp.]